MKWLKQLWAKLIGKSNENANRKPGYKPLSAMGTILPPDFAADEDQTAADTNERPWWDFEGCKKKQQPFFEDIDPNKTADTILNMLKTGEFPVIEVPDTVMKAMQILNQPDFDFNDVVEIVNRSPAMAGECIRIANSSLYSRGSNISDLRAALTRLGRNTVKAMLFMYSSRMCLAENVLFNDLAQSINDHCYATALIANYLSRRYYTDPDSAFFAGLLHDVGKLGILKAFCKTYDLPETIDFSLSEDTFHTILPNLHESAGECLAYHWKLDKHVITGIGHHHDFGEANFEAEDILGPPLCCLINVADAMARILGKGRPIGRTNVFDLPAAQTLNLENDADTRRFLEDIPRILAYKTA